MGIAALIARQARARPAATYALRWQSGEALSYAWAHSCVMACAARLLELCPERGRVVVIAMRNSPELILIMAACEAAGLVPAPVNWRLNEIELGELLARAAAEVVATDAEFLPTIREAVAARRPGAIVVEAVDLASTRGSAGFEPVRARSTDTGLILFTSGTTGAPRAAEFAHAALEAFGPIGQSVLGLEPADVGLVALPCFHTAALHGQVYPALEAGSTLVFYGGTFDPHRILELAARHRVSWTLLGSRRVIELEAVLPSAAPLPDLRLLVLAGGRLPETALASIRAHASPSLRVMHVMGMTEVGTYLLIVPPEDFAAKNGALGRPHPRFEVRLDQEAAGAGDPDRLSRYAGEPVGEMVVRGPTIIKGYTGVTRSALDSEGWFRSGDLVRRDHDGYLWIIDRLKDVIKTGGENVSSSSVCETLLQLPGVRSAAAVGVPHPKWGEAVGVILTADPKAALDPAAVVAWCRQRLSGFKRPRYVLIAEEIPMNESGRPRRDRIAELLMQQGEV